MGEQKDRYAATDDRETEHGEVSFAGILWAHREFESPFRNAEEAEKFRTPSVLISLREMNSISRSEMSTLCGSAALGPPCFKLSIEPHRTRHLHQIYTIGS